MGYNKEAKGLFVQRNKTEKEDEPYMNWVYKLELKRTIKGVKYAISIVIKRNSGGLFYDADGIKIKRLIR